MEFPFMSMKDARITAGTIPFFCPTATTGIWSSTPGYTSP